MTALVVAQHKTREAQISAMMATMESIQKEMVRPRRLCSSMYTPAFHWLAWFSHIASFHQVADRDMFAQSIAALAKTSANR